MKTGVSREATGNSKKIGLFALAFWTLFLAYSISSEAQQPKKIRQIGYLLTNTGAEDRNRATEIVRRSLEDLGYVEGRNIVTHYRSAEGKLDRLPALAAELVGLNVDVIITSGDNGTRAAQKATSTIPIVMPNVGDPVEQGFVKSLAHPGGNITGLTTISAELSGKRLELIKELFPKSPHTIVLWNPNEPSSRRAMQEMEVPAQRLGMQLQSVEVRGPPDFDKAFSIIAAKGGHVLLSVRGAITNNHEQKIAAFAIKQRVPSMGSRYQFAERGGLLAYGANDFDLARRAAVYVDKILKGAKPADLPVEQPTKFELVINLKTAKQIGLTIPQSVLYRADKVIK
jgi:putative tryptophan/tyrosine transport system substrate-binding protein